jgi:hypothetical protein
MPSSRLRVQTVFLLWIFGLQFLAGMILNLFVELPKTHPGAGGEYFSSSWASLLWALGGGSGWALAVHTWLALLLFLGTLLLFLRSLVAGGQGWRWPSGIAALLTLGAVFNGLSFADYGEAFSSMIMASCWLVAVALLVFALIRAQPESAITPRRERHHD